MVAVKHLLLKKQVRRLTPLECERLQGYPDGYTNIPGASDSARYKALGNSFAIPNIYFVIKRIKEVSHVETISLIILVNIACIGIVYGTYRLMAWLDKRRELMELSIEYYKRQIRGE